MVVVIGGGVVVVVIVAVAVAAIPLRSLRPYRKCEQCSDIALRPIRTRTNCEYLLV